jgi:hypothetical protein
MSKAMNIHHILAGYEMMRKQGGKQEVIKKPAEAGC